VRIAQETLPSLPAESVEICSQIELDRDPADKILMPLEKPSCSWGLVAVGALSTSLSLTLQPI